jgi:IS1 transposase
MPIPFIEMLDALLSLDPGPSPKENREKTHESPEAARRYSPSECVGTWTETITGKPDPKHVSTSYAERANLTMRMAMRRFTRLTNAFSKKLENHDHMVALYYKTHVF